VVEAARFGQNERRSERRVTGELELRCRREDPDARGAAGIGGRMNVVSEKFISRASRCICSLEISRASVEDTELVSLERSFGEGVTHDVGEGHLFSLGAIGRVPLAILASHIPGIPRFINPARHLASYQ
jgi:hypothetical protein